MSEKKVVKRLEPAHAKIIQENIKSKLSEFLPGGTTDDVLPEYILVMVANKKTREQISSELVAFLGQRADDFSLWLWQYLTAFASGGGATTSTSSSAPPPTSTQQQQPSASTSTSGSTSSVVAMAKEPTAVINNIPPARAPGATSGYDYVISGDVKMEVTADNHASPIAGVHSHHSHQHQHQQHVSGTSAGTSRGREREREKRDESRDRHASAAAAGRSASRDKERDRDRERGRSGSERRTKLMDRSPKRERSSSGRDKDRDRERTRSRSEHRRREEDVKPPLPPVSPPTAGTTVNVFAPAPGSSVSSLLNATTGGEPSDAQQQQRVESAIAVVKVERPQPYRSEDGGVHAGGRLLFGQAVTQAVRQHTITAASMMMAVDGDEEEQEPSSTSAAPKSERVGGGSAAPPPAPRKVGRVVQLKRPTNNNSNGSGSGSGLGMFARSANSPPLPPRIDQDDDEEEAVGPAPRQLGGWFRRPASEAALSMDTEDGHAPPNKRKKQDPLFTVTFNGAAQSKAPSTTTTRRQLQTATRRPARERLGGKRRTTTTSSSSSTLPPAVGGSVGEQDPSRLAQRLTRFGPVDDLPLSSSSPTATAAAGAPRCRYWPTCRTEGCTFHHPSEPCKYFPNCMFGADQCKYIHPAIPCKYGLACERADCSYWHAPPTSMLAPILPPFVLLDGPTQPAARNLVWTREPF